MERIECPRNRFVASVLEDNVAQIIRAQADCIEDFEIDDIMISAVTNNTIVGIPCENKTLLGGWQFKYDGEWNTYFTGDIYDKLQFHTLPPDEGEPIYFINATDSKGDYSKGKYSKIIASGGALTFLAPDCVIFYTCPMLQDAFVGYADYFVRRKTEFGKDYRRHWEVKSVLNLNKGLYIPCSPPIELFEK